jgi:hypothetical protein
MTARGANSLLGRFLATCDERTLRAYNDVEELTTPPRRQ